MKVLLPIEVKGRDFHPRLYLASRLAKAGYHCVLGRKAAVENLARRLGHQVIWIDKGLTPQKLDLYTSLKNAGGRLFHLHEEGGVLHDTVWKVFAENAHSPEVLPYVSKHFCWGDVHRQLLAETYPDYAATFETTGNPRFDLRKQRGDDIYAELAGSKIRRDAVLFSSSFVEPNPLMGLKIAQRDAKKSLHAYHDGNLQAMRFHYSSLVQLCFLNLVTDLAKQLPEGMRIIYRPHPAENRELYEKLFQGMERVEVSRANNFHGDLIHAKAVVHHDCTTGIEAFINGRAVFSYCPVFNSALAAPLPQKVSMVFSGHDELIENLCRLLKGETSEDEIRASLGRTRAEAEAILEPLIDNVRRDCCERVVKFVAAESPASGKNDDADALRFSSKEVARDKLLEPTRKKERGKIPYIHLKEVTDFCDAIQATTSISPMEVVDLGCETFAIRCIEEA